MISRRGLICGAACSALKVQTVMATDISDGEFLTLYREVIREALAAGLDIPARAPSDKNEQVLTTLADIVQKATGSLTLQSDTLASHAGELLIKATEKFRDLPTSADRAEAPPSFPMLKSEYKTMFQKSIINISNHAAVDAIAKKIIEKDYSDIYKMAEEETGVPWYIIGALHYRETNFNFMSHLHNGDYLKRKTSHFPPERPLGKWPPYPWNARVAWIASTKDALSRFKNVSNWTLERTLYSLEAYNGWGYRSHPGYFSPYIWNYTQFYKSGGYPCDSCWSTSYKSKQAGLAAVILALHQAAPGLIHLHYEL